MPSYLPGATEPPPTLVNRRKILQVEMAFLGFLFRTGDPLAIQVTDGLPKDAQVVGVQSCPGYPSRLDLIVVSEEFPEVPDGYALETVRPPLFTRFSGDAILEAFKLREYADA